jgi:hypothetical protein
LAFNNAAAQNTYFLMPEHAVTVTVNFVNVDPYAHLTKMSPGDLPSDWFIGWSSDPTKNREADARAILAEGNRSKYIRFFMRGGGRTGSANEWNAAKINESKWFGAKGFGSAPPEGKDITGYTSGDVAGSATDWWFAFPVSSMPNPGWQGWDWNSMGLDFSAGYNSDSTSVVLGLEIVDSLQ